MRHTPRFPERRDNVYNIDGEKYVSTTTVLSALAKPALLMWAAKLSAAAVLSDPYTYDTAEKAAAVINQTKGAAGERGRNLHDLIEKWASGGDLSTFDMDNKYERGFVTFVRAWNPKPLLTECTIVNKTHKYAGRLDLIAEIGAETWLVDFKTSKAVWPEMGLQLSAYRNAEFIRCQEGDPLRPMPAVSKTGVVLIPGDGNFSFAEVNEPFEVFLALMQVHAWSKLKSR